MKLELAFARMEATVSSDLRHLVHDVKNLKMSLEAFMPSKQINEKHDAMDERHDALAERVKVIEGHISRGAWAIVLAWVAGIGVAIKAMK